VPSKTGAGLGLVAARRFLSEIGGTLSFAAAPGGGTLCRVSLSGGTCASRQDLAPARG
jgi:C4-dicarboxylate-specific signal transduction histidine kinase